MRRNSSSRGVEVFFPLQITLLWWALCTALFVLAWPLPYEQTNGPLVVLLLGSCAVFLVLGFCWRLPVALTTVPLPSRYPRIVIYGVLLSLLLIFPVVAAYSGFSILELGTALFNQGAAFERSTERILEGSGSRSLVLALQTVAAPLTLIAVPGTALYWFERRRGLWWFIAALVAPLVTSIMVGRDQQLGWTGILVAGTWVLSRARRGLPIFNRRILIILLLAGIAFVTLFSLRKNSRSAVLMTCFPGVEECFREVSPVQSAVLMISSYMSQGLEGLGRALNTEWTFGGGFSHSPAVHDLLVGVLGLHPAETVTRQLEQVDWSATWYWSTALTSLANDVHWLIIPLLFFFFGIFLRTAWFRALSGGDPLSTAVFALTFLGMLFVPLNLQLAVSGPTYLGFLALVVLFLARAMRPKYKRSPAHLQPYDFIPRRLRTRTPQLRG